MELKDAVVGARVKMLDGKEYVVTEVREPENPKGFSELSLQDVSEGADPNRVVKGDTRQAELVSVPEEKEFEASTESLPTSEESTTDSSLKNLFDKKKALAESESKEQPNN